MKVKLNASNLAASDALDAHARKRLGFALGKLAHRIKSAAVRITDVNGPRGGLDKHCLVRVELHPRGTVVLSDTATDAYGAIDRATGRLKHAVRKAIDRQTCRRERRRR